MASYWTPCHVARLYLLARASDHEPLFRGFLDRLHLRAKLVDKNTLVLRVVDRHDHEVHAAGLESGFENGNEIGGLANPRALCAVAFRVVEECLMGESQAEIR